jgi:DNA polymerase-3 subunit beta
MTIRLTVHAEDLRAAVDFAGKLCSTKPTQPILHGVLVEADEALTMSAFDGDLAGRVTISAGVIEPGTALVPGRFLAQIVKTTGKADVVDLVCTPDRITVGDGRNHWSLPAMDLLDYPDLPTPSEPIGEVDGAVLRRAITRALAAAEKPGHDLRFFAAVSMIAEADRLAVCGFDGYRLAVSYVPWEGGGLNLLVPAAVLSAAAGFLGPEGVAAGLSADRGLVTLATASHRLTGRLVAGRWPGNAGDWRGQLAQFAEPVAAATFVVGELRTAVERVIVVSDEKRPGALMKISEGDVELSGWADDRDGVAVASCADYEAKPREVAFNPWYLRDALNSLGCDLAMMRFGPRAVSPFDIVPLDEDGKPDENYRCVIMPIDPSKLRRAAA